MSAAVARGHGGDAGGDPPPPPNTIPTSCQASAKKKKRGLSVSKNLNKAFVANDSKPLPIQFDLKKGTFKPLGDVGRKFTRYIGNYIGKRISPQYPSWKDVPASNRKSIIKRLQRFFILDKKAPEWPQIATGIERNCQDIYRDRKAKLKEYFRTIGGYEDPEHAKRNPPSHVDLDHWEKTVDRFLDPKHIARSEKIVQNRGHTKYPSLQGSVSFIARRHKMSNPETQEIQGAIENWKSVHYRPNSGWVNDLARIDYEAMLRELAAQTQEHGSTASSIDEDEIITKVLGERRGHKRGIGRKLKGPESSMFFDPSPPPSPPPPPPPPLSLGYDGIKRVLDGFQVFQGYMNQAYEERAPGSQLPPPPPPTCYQYATIS